MTDEVILFATNGDGTVDCSWCGKRFAVDDAIPDDGDDPICPQCYASAQAEESAKWCCNGVKTDDPTVDQHESHCRYHSANFKPNAPAPQKPSAGEIRRTSGSQG